MSEEQAKHLELVQAVVRRLAQNSFAYKGWTIVLVSAIFALATKQTRPEYLLVALIPAIAFWGLDAYYLRQERLFRKLYDAARRAPRSEFEVDPFTMDTTPHADQAPSWWGTCWSRTIAWLYGPMVLLILAVTGIARGFG